MKWRQIRRRSFPFLCLVAAVVIFSLGSESFRSSWEAMGSGSTALELLRWELGDYQDPDGLSPAVVLALAPSPTLMSLRGQLTPREELPSPAPEVAMEAAAETVTPPASQAPETPLTYPDNGVPSQTVIPTAAGNYTVIRDVYIKNASRQTLDTELLSEEHFAATLTHDAPQVLIVHTHGSEAYSLPAGQEYHSTGTFRTDDDRYSVIRVGDEVASVLSSYGISVLHDRALYDDPYYEGAYDRAAEAIAAYQEKYPTLTYIIDLHRDAVQDAGGRQYKLVSRDDPTLAQISMVMGSSHEGWEENLKLAMAVSREIETAHPTTMRPITLRNSNYNQAASLGMLLVEIGAAGNSLEEAIHAGQVFGQGFAQAVINNAAVG